MTATSQLITLTAEITSAHCRHNTVAAEALPGLIRQIYLALASVTEPEQTSQPEAKLVPAVPIKRSVFPEYIVCLEDGKKLKTLKRHLNSSYSMTPADYRARWDLPNDYPMVAPSYAQKRSELAKKIGLGRGHDSGEANATNNTEDGRNEVTVQQVPEQKRGRRKA